MVSGFCILFLFLSAFGYGNEGIQEPLMVESHEAAYDGKNVVLTGNVVIQHGLGEISGRCFSLSPSEIKGKRGKFSSLEISGGVNVLLKGGGKLSCEQASLDNVRMRGVFIGSNESPDVIYIDDCFDEDDPSHQKVPFEVKSRQMNLDMIRQEDADIHRSKILIKQLEALDNVRIFLDHEYILVADHALFQRMAGCENSPTEGLLKLSTKGVLPFCRLTSTHGDSLNARTIEFNTAQQKLSLTEPEGKVSMKQDTASLQSITFKSDELTWDHGKQLLVLKGNVDIVEEGSLHLSTRHEMSISRTIRDGKHVLEMVRSPLSTRISYSDPENGNTHSIYCPGSLVIDHEAQQMVLQGSLDHSLEDNEKGQVYFEGIFGEMHADAVQVFYHWDQGKFSADKIILEGNVHLLNRFGGHIDEAGSVLHFGLADRIECSIREKEALLEASEGSRVLFFDKVNNVQMSAPSLKIREDAVSHREIIQGMGDVRFTFLENEMIQLKEHFKQKEFAKERMGRGR